MVATALRKEKKMFVNKERRIENGVGKRKVKEMRTKGEKDLYCEKHTHTHSHAYTYNVYKYVYSL